MEIHFYFSVSPFVSPARDRSNEQQGRAVIGVVVLMSEFDSIDLKSVLAELQSCAATEQIFFVDRADLNC